MTKQCTQNGRINQNKMIRKLRKYTILVHRNGADSIPCQVCCDYLYDKGFRKVICTYDNQLVKFNLADYRSIHLSDSQKKFKELHKCHKHKCIG